MENSPKKSLNAQGLEDALGREVDATNVKNKIIIRFLNCTPFANLI